MIYANGKISARQMFALIFTEFVGSGIIMANIIARRMCGRDGVVALTAAGIGAVLIAILLLNYSGFNSNSGLKILWIFSTAKYVARMVFCFIFVAAFVKNNMLQNKHIFIIVIPLLILLAYGLSMNIESRARLSEVTLWFIVVAIIVAVYKGSQGFDVYNLSPVFVGSKEKVFICTFIIFALFYPVEMLLWCKEYINNTKSAKVDEAISNNRMISSCRENLFIILGIVLCSVLSVVFFIISQGTNRDITDSAGIIPMNSLIMLNVSILQLMISYGGYAKACFDKIRIRETSGSWLGNVVVVGSVVLSTVIWFVWGTANVGKSDNYSEVNAATDNVENNIEQKSYVMIMGIDYSESEGFQVWLNEANDAKEKNVKKWTGSHLDLMKNSIKNVSNSEIDFSNIKTIVVGTGVIHHKKKFQELIEYLKASKGMEGESYVVATNSSPEKIVEASMNQKIYRYEYINEMLSNNFKDYKVTLSYFVSNIAGDARKSIRMKNFKVNEEEIICDGSIVANYDGKYSVVEANADVLLDCIEGTAEGEFVATEEGDICKVGFVNENISLDIINNETVGVHIMMEGGLEKIKGNDKSEDEMNEWMELQTESLLQSMLMDEGLDYVQVYNRLSVEDRIMWMKYIGREKQLYKHIYFNVNCDFKMS